MSTASLVRERNSKDSERHRPRVLMVSPRYLPDQGGIEIHVNEVGRRMAALGVDLTVLTTADVDEATQDESADGFRVIRVPYWPRGRDWRIAPAVGKVVCVQDLHFAHELRVHPGVHRESMRFTG